MDKAQVVSKPKRNRISSICFNCRRRKLRCDRKAPFCGRCEFDKCTDTCTYEKGADQTFSNSITNEVEIVKLKTQIKELESTISYQKKIIHGFQKSADISSSKIIGTTSLQKSSRINQKFSGYAILESNLVYLEPTSYLCTALEDSNLSLMFSDAYTNRNESELSCYNEADVTSTPFKEKLPPVEEIDNLLRCFFEFSHPFIPFFDEDQILSQIRQLLDDRDTYSVINPSKSNQSSLMAILLIMLRFAYITVSWNNPILEDLQKNFNINESYVDTATSLLMAPQSFKNVKLEKIKGLLLLRIYKMHCPEDDDTSYSSLIITSALVQSARVLGLHQDVNKCPEAFLSDGSTQSWRVIWANICYLDNSYAFDKGSSPITHLSEVQRIVDIDFQLGRAKISSIMMFTARYIRKFLSSEIKERVIIEEEVLNLAQSISNILVEQSRNFQQLITKNHNDLGESVSDRAREFVLRLDLVYKEFSSYILLYSNTESSKKNEYLSLAFERSLILLRILHQSIVNKISYFNAELDRLIFPRICIGPRMIFLVFIKVTETVLSGQFSLLESLKYFTSQDSIGIINWMNVSFGSEKDTLYNVLLRVYEVYSEGSKLSSLNYSCFKVCLFLRLTLVYICNKYMEAPEELNCDVGWKNPASFKEVIQSWKKKYEQNSLYSVEAMFSGLNNELDDFLKGLDSDWMEQYDCQS